MKTRLILPTIWVVELIAVFGCSATTTHKQQSPAFNTITSRVEPPPAELINMGDSSRAEPAAAFLKRDKSNASAERSAAEIDERDIAIVENISPPLSDKIAARAKQNAQAVDAQLDYQLLQFLKEQPVPDLEGISHLPAEDREILSSVMDSLSSFRSTIRSGGTILVSKKIRPFLELADRLRSQAELSIPTVALCGRVDGFGVYEPIDPARFEAGKENPVIVYCELDNFTAQLNDKKTWETKLKQQMVLYSESGLAVWQNKPRSIVDASRNHRRDFFTVELVRLPATLPIGRYVLKVTVTDEHVSRVAETSAPVQIVAADLSQAAP